MNASLAYSVLEYFSTQYSVLSTRARARPLSCLCVCRAAACRRRSGRSPNPAAAAAEPAVRLAHDAVRLHAGHVHRPGRDHARVAAAAHAADVADQCDLGDCGRGGDRAWPAREHPLATSTLLGAIALFASTTNIVSGFLITDRMLKMFKRQERHEAVREFLAQLARDRADVPGRRRRCSSCRCTG